MTVKAEPAGWVVQITIAAPIASAQAGWVGPITADAPAFQYFNVAIIDPVEAVEATRAHSGADKDASIAPVRPLSSAELASIPLKAGEVKPA
jgi:hypothetical protein